MNDVQGGRIIKKKFRENKIDPKIENRGAYPLKIDLYGSKFSNFVIFVKTSRWPLGYHQKKW